jgi:epoxyqueuosine reductase
MQAADLKRLAIEAGFDLAGVAPAVEMPEWEHYMGWVSRGMAGRMGYLTDHRADRRRDVRTLLPAARSVLVVGQLYNAPLPYSTTLDDEARAWISRYAWGDDYHDVMREKLKRVQSRLPGCESKICIDTAPVLERPLARMAGLGWIGKNACLINQEKGSWFFLGELITSLTLEADAPPADRCGSCTRCIDACPTDAIVPRADSASGYEVDARLCIAYLNIELNGDVPEPLRRGMGRHVFGCDICQDVCPWNRRARSTEAAEWQPRVFFPPLEELAALTPEQFDAMFHGSPIERTRYRGFVRNVAIAMGNAGLPSFRAPLERLAASDDAVIAEHARWALARLEVCQ